MYTVYALKDPRDGSIRYVGITIKSAPERRLTEHVRNARKGVGTHVYCWIRQLLQLDLKPEFVVLEQTDDPDCERYWIIELRAQGYRLTNGTDGGVHFHHSDETKQKLSDIRRLLWKDPDYANKKRGQPRPPFSPEWKANISVARRALPPPSEDQKQKTRKSLLGKRHSEERRARMRIGQQERFRREREEGIVRHRTEEIKKKISESMTKLRQKQREERHKEREEMCRCGLIDVQAEEQQREARRKEREIQRRAKISASMIKLRAKQREEKMKNGLM